MNLDRKPDAVLQTELLQMRDMVYAWKRGGEYLYIGFTGRGLCRPFSHHVIGVADSIQDGDTLELWFFEELKPSLDGLCYGMPEGIQFESEMIRKHRPKYNITDNPDRQPKPRQQKTTKPVSRWEASEVTETDTPVDRMRSEYNNNMRREYAAAFEEVKDPASWE